MHNTKKIHQGQSEKCKKRRRKESAFTAQNTQAKLHFLCKKPLPRKFPCSNLCTNLDNESANLSNTVKLISPRKSD